MNRSFKLLKNTVIIYLLLFSLNALSYSCVDDEEYSKAGLEVVLSFMSGEKKCLEYTSNIADDKSIYYSFRNLKEFKINKNGKYCLWGSKNWDDECQDASLEYAYGDYGRHKGRGQKFKKIIIDFIKHIQNNEINKALELTSSDAMFFTDDDAYCLAKRSDVCGDECHGCSSYFNKLHKDKDEYDDFNLEAFRESLMQIDVDHLKFFILDVYQNMTYGVIIPYEYKNVKKEFSIVFYYSRGSNGVSFFNGIYHLSIYSPMIDRRKF